MSRNLQDNALLLASALALVAISGCEKDLDITRTAYRCTSSSNCVQGFVCRDLGDGRGRICVDVALAAGKPDASGSDGGDMPGADADVETRPPIATVELAEAVGTSAAHKFVGAQTQQQFGWSVSSAGDFNNDGLSDFVVGAPMFQSGRAYLFLGRRDRGFSPTALGADRSWGLRDHDRNRVGSSLAGAGDGFGTFQFDDYIVGAKGVGDAPGSAYLISGSGLALPETMSELSDTAHHTEIIGEQPGSGLGHAVAAVGDVDGDGSDDFLLGAPLYTDDSSAVGAAYLVLGSSLTGANVSLNNEGIKFTGTLSDGWAGKEVAAAGDFNGDNYPDFLIGAPQASAAYLILGHDELDQENPRSLDGADLIFESARRSQLGTSMVSLGDIDADGFDDILIGDSDGTGAVYLVRGRGELGHRTFDIRRADLKFVAGSPGNPGPSNLSVGDALARAGDVDGDGVEDILIGASGRSAGIPDSRGAVYLVSGAVLLEHLNEDTFYLDHADVRFVGEDYGDNLGRTLDGVGDIDGDGCDDILMGSRSHGFEDGSTTRRGAAYLVYGPANGAGQTCD